MDAQRTSRVTVISLLAALVITVAPAWAKTTAFFGVGSNSSGQLGMGAVPSRAAFTFIPGMADALTIEAGHFQNSVALKPGGLLFVAGDGNFGQLGTANTTDLFVFTQVTPPEDADACTAGVYHTVVLRDGALLSTGDNSNGALGLGHYNSRNTFTAVGGLDGVSAVEAGSYFTFALRSDNTLWGTGQNGYGQLGRGYTTDVFDPMPNTFAQAIGLTNVHAVSGGAYHALALDNNGDVWATGYNYWGELGVADLTDRNVFTAVSGIEGNVIAIAAGDAHSLALTDDGKVWATGSNGSGQLGRSADSGTYVSSFSQAPGIADVIAIGAAPSGSLAVKSDGTLWVCGDNSGGRLGLGGKIAGVYGFTQVPGLVGVRSATASMTHAIVNAAYGVEVTYPSSDDITLERGRTYNITWDSFNLPPKTAVKIELVKGGSETWTISPAATKMPFKWTVGKVAKGSTPYANGDDYKIRVSLLDGTDLDDSDNDFAIGQVTGLTVNGPATVDGGNSQQYTCSAQYDFGADADVTALVKWSCSKVLGAKMGKTGLLATTEVGTDTPCTITATYGKGKPPISGTTDITIVAD